MIPESRLQRTSLFCMLLIVSGFAEFEVRTILCAKFIDSNVTSSVTTSAHFTWFGAVLAAACYRITWSTWIYNPVCFYIKRAGIRKEAGSRLVSSTLMTRRDRTDCFTSDNALVLTSHPSVYPCTTKTVHPTLYLHYKRWGEFTSRIFDW